jgi:O-antigen ligase
MLGAMLFVADFARRRIWRERLLFTVAIVGASVAALGIVQRSSGALSIFWNGIDRETFFATFRYHSNAGAFINLTLPVIAFQLYRACMKRSSAMIRWGWEIAYLLTFAAVIASGSRVAAALACAATVVVFGVFGQCRVWGRRKAVSSAVLFAVVVGVATFSAGSRIANRWRELPGQFSSENPRLLVYGVCADMAHDVGWFGFGPGTFAAAFPYYSSPLGERASGIWLHAHNDYLQAVIEWGWEGAALFGLLFGFLLVCQWPRLRRNAQGAHDPAGDRLIALAIGTVFLHALVDFPLQIASIQIYIAALLGAMTARTTNSREAESEHRSLISNCRRTTARLP